MPLPVRVLTEMPENLKLTGAIAEALQRAGLEAGARFERESIRSAPLRFDWDVEMTQFYQPPLDGREEDPFVRDGDDKLIRRSYWLDRSQRPVPPAPAGISRERAEAAASAADALATIKVNGPLPSSAPIEVAARTPAPPSPLFADRG
jgi:hypothetical protein